MLNAGLFSSPPFPSWAGERASKMLIEGIPELTSYREINKMLTQVIAVHSLFNSFQNTLIDDTAFLLPIWR